MQPGIILKKGKEKFLKQRHLWIFSGAISTYPARFENGNLYPVYSFDRGLLGYGYFNQNCSLAGRMASFGNEEAEKALLENLKQALLLREKLFSKTKTNAYRLVNAEGDNLPGLIVDRYADFLVVQIGTLGMEKLKDKIVAWLVDLLKPKGIYEKSNMPSRKEENLENCEGLLFGEDADEITILENGLVFKVSYKTGQKTGFFLDQREMRSLVYEYAAKRQVLNCFGYTGAFSVYALKGGAHTATTVDISQDALNMAKKNCALNQLTVPDSQFVQADVFDFLRQKLEYDFVILDPPAFAKKKKDVLSAARGYKEINRLTLSNLPPQSWLLTCSCSYHVDEKLFSQILFSAALEAKRQVKIISRHRQAPDHVMNIYHPEGSYLKSLLLYVQ